jgi:hypothetical protein
MDATVRCCPLCGSPGGPILETVEYSRIYAALERKWSPHFSAELVSGHTPAPRTNLRECARSGLRYFTPCAPGGRHFYERLMLAAGYEDDRWEFGEVAMKLRTGDAVIEVGCGQGAFCDASKARWGAWSAWTQTRMQSPSCGPGHRGACGSDRRICESRGRRVRRRLRLPDPRASGERARAD